MSSLKKRAVAVSFIFKFPNGNVSRRPQVALFRRSGKVNTYPHKLAPISGGVETQDASPLATAWRELAEETTLTATSLRLFRQGKPYSFTDLDIGREWTINPFAFILKSAQQGGAAGEEGIKIDWEHEAFQWFDPDEISSDESFHQGVPRLKESLRRVWFEIDLGKDAANVLAAGLKALQDDHVSGARELAAKALNIYLDVISRLETNDQTSWWKNARFAAWHLWKNGRESMGAPILSVVLSSLDIIEKHLPTSSSSLSNTSVEQICAAIKDFGNARQQSGNKIVNTFASFLDQFPKDKPLKILTLSSSSTITSSLIHVLSSASSSHRPLDIHILESRPLFEGVKVAQRISSIVQAHANTNVSITLHSDASAALASQNAHILLLGADLIDRSGNVSNKTGSLPTVLAAKHVSPGVKIVVVAEKEKILPFDPPEHDEDNDAGELERSWGDVGSASERKLPGVNVKNVYFEWVPATMVDVYLTEDGVEGTEDVERWAGEVRQKADRFFDDL
ncbi:hypothetical protein ACHAPV_008185 [Trichoderma viride]